MIREPSPETLKRALELTRDIEPTQSMLAALGLVMADVRLLPDDTPHPEDDRWADNIIPSIN